MRFKYGLIALSTRAVLACAGTALLALPQNEKMPTLLRALCLKLNVF